MSKMTFGKYEGLPIEKSPTDYLIWCYENMGFPPKYVADEIVRRGYRVTTKTGRKGKKKRRVVSAKPQQPKLWPHKEGEHYQKLHDEFLRADGDEEQCPFDFDDYVYDGPVLTWSGDRPFIVPPEFPRRISQ